MFFIGVFSNIVFLLLQPEVVILIQYLKHYVPVIPSLYIYIYIYSVYSNALFSQSMKVHEDSYMKAKCMVHRRFPTYLRTNNRTCGQTLRYTEVPSHIYYSIQILLFYSIRVIPRSSWTCSYQSAVTSFDALECSFGE